MVPTRGASFPTLTLADAHDPGAGARRAAVAFERCHLVMVAHGAAVDRDALRRELARHLSSHVVILDAEVHVEPGAVLVTGAPRGVRAAVRVFPSVGRVTYALARNMLATLAADLGLVPEHLRPDRHLVMCLSEAGAGGEEILAAAMASADPGLPLVGATFDGARMEVEGEPLAGRAAVVLFHSPVPLGSVFFHPWHLTPTRTVVTACDPATRLVRRLDGRPAVARLAALTGADDPVSSTRQLAWVVGGHVVARPVVAVHGDCLEVGGAVERGTVLRLVEAVANPTAALVRQVEHASGALPVPTAGAWLAADTALAHPARQALHALPASVLSSTAQQYGPIHTCRAAVGILWGATG